MEEDDNTLVLHVIPPPELHLQMGVVNHILDLLIDIFGDLILDWMKNNQIYRRGYQGGGLSGNNCRKFLKLVEKLNIDSRNWTGVSFVDILPFVGTLRSFDKVGIFVK